VKEAVFNDEEGKVEIGAVFIRMLILGKVSG
jgi:hypothetical protein